MRKSFLFITCKEAHRICDKAQYGDATPWERIKLAIRLSWCGVSQAYTKKNNTLTKAIDKANLDALSQHEIENMQVKLRTHLKNQNQ